MVKASELAELKQYFQDIKEMMGNLSKKVETIEQTMQTMQATLLKKVEAAVTKAKEEILSSVTAELRERACRQSSLVMYNCAETQMETNDETKQLFIDICHRPDVAIKEEDIFARRLGRYQAGAAKPRVIHCRLMSAHQKEMILGAGRKLNDIGMGMIGLQNDLTIQQREEHKALRAEAKKRNDEKNDLNEDEEWRVVGRRGAARLVKVKKNPGGGHTTTAT